MRQRIASRVGRSLVVIETKDMLKAWKEQYDSNFVEGWLQV
jgi:hypothetical protein